MPQVAEDLEMRLVALCLLAALASGGCSIKKFAINKLGDSLANSGTTYAADDDPELIGQALPFSLKLVEGLLAESPEHRGLLLAAASGFTEYAYAYVNQDADMIEPESLEKATALRGRSRAHPFRSRGGADERSARVAVRVARRVGVGSESGPRRVRDAVEARAGRQSRRASGVAPAESDRAAARALAARPRRRPVRPT